MGSRFRFPSLPLMLVMWVCMFCRSLYEVFAIAMKSCVVCVFPFELFIPPTLVLFFCGFLINCRVFWVARSPRRWFFSHFFALVHTHWIEWVLLCCTLYSIRLENYTSTNLITTAPPSVYVCVLRWKLQSSKWPLEKNTIHIADNGCECHVESQCVLDDSRWKWAFYAPKFPFDKYRLSVWRYLSCTQSCRHTHESYTQASEWVECVCVCVG